ncbi:hypothetical protein [Gluconobacter potus]|uniref:hypothetical protein n=1 Tax=Gluconobacter potus TaxID=2724927 RepID=UPI0039EB4A83
MLLYVGVEVMAENIIGIYGQGFGPPLSQTRFFTSLTLPLTLTLTAMLGDTWPVL